MQQVFSIPKSIKQNSTFTFCPGCDHGVAVKLVAQIIDELNIQEHHQDVLFYYTIFWM